MLILGIESSCDETALAISRDGREILSNCVLSQIDMHTIYGGVVPEIASRKHIEAITGLADQALKEAGVTRQELDAIAVTYAPGLIGALLVGVNFAKAGEGDTVMKLNEALYGAKRSAIREFSELAGRTPGCVALTLGEPDFATPQPICSAVTDALTTGQTHYIDNNGTRASSPFSATSSRPPYSTPKVATTFSFAIRPVMFLGCICEIGSTEEIYNSPMHPYTKFLLDSVPQPDPTQRDDDKELLTGEIPSPVNPPSGCRFRTRCPYATDKCAKEVPELKTYGDRQVACHYPLNINA